MNYKNSYIHPSAVIEEGVQIGQGSKIWHFTHIRKNVVIEDLVSIGKSVYVDEGIRISRGTRVQNDVSIYKGINIAPWCFIGPNVTFTNDRTPRAGVVSWDIIPTSLETGVSIGAGAIIICGITIGAFAMIGAGSIVTKDIPPFTLALGSPANVIKKICACGKSSTMIDNCLSTTILDCCRKNLPHEILEYATLLSK